MTASLANGGKSVVPHLVEGLFNSEGKQQNKVAIPESRQIFSTETAETVLNMMETVVTSPTGSGGKAKICGYRIAGKTGTAQKNGVKGYQADSQKITSFVGILPVDKQRRYVVFAAVDRPNENRGKAFGSNVAAPIVKLVMESLISIEGIPPSDPNQKCPSTSK
jgi:cell division protein FtsI (penicillin-binding protein 3)